MKCSHTLLVLIVFKALSTVSFSQKRVYRDYNTMTRHLESVVKESKNLLKLSSIAKTHNDRDVWLVTVSIDHDRRKPALLIAGGLEPADIAGSELCTIFLDSLVAAAQTDSIKMLLQKATLYVIPRANPDAVEKYFKTPRYEYRLVSNDRDLDKDGFINEDGYEDLNKDGIISQMRVVDPQGEWCSDPDIPQLLKKCEPGKTGGTRFRLYTEGVDNDKDGRFNEDGPGGVDVSRNFPFEYVYFDPETGDYQLSEPEARAIVDFCFDHPNIAAVFSFSKSGNLVSPWEAYKKDPQDRRLLKVLKGDQAYYKSITDIYRKTTGFKNAPEYKRTGGDFPRWVYFHYGRWSLSAPAWWPPVIEEKPDSTKDEKSGSAADKKPKTGAKKDSIKNQRQLYNWLQATGRQHNFLQWQEIEHPDFPRHKVQVGGFVPYAGFVPAADSLRPVAEKMNQYVLKLAQKLPAVSIKDVYVESLGDGVFRISLLVVNDGFLPTNSQMGERLKWARSVKAEIVLSKDQHLKSGRTCHLLDAIPGNGAGRELFWIVTSPPNKKIVVRAGSPMTGMDEKTVTLKE